jgi:protein-disulfide isomerase-like protein with CxxC motif
MVGKWVQFDDETWHEIQAVARQTGKSFQELASVAFANLLKEQNQPVDFKPAVEASVTSGSKFKKASKRLKPRRRRD